MKTGNGSKVLYKVRIKDLPKDERPREKLTRDYNNLFERIAGILASARTNVVREINRTQVLAYWEIGREVVEFEQKGKTRAGLVDEKFSEKAVKEALDILAKEYSHDANSILVATKVHRRVYEIIENPDPYKDIKERSNRIALSLIPKAEKFIKNSNDKLKAAVICAIVGNVFDFGIKSSIAAPEKLGDNFEKMCENGLDVDDTEKIRKYLKKNSRVLFFTDNCGEIVFDKLLCREIKKFGVHLTVVVRESPIMNDATVEDAEKLGFKDAADEIMLSSNAVGIDFNEISDDLKGRIENADLIICKGMGMYEAFCEKKYRPVVHLLRTKCMPVADDMGLPENISVAKMYE